MGAARSRVPAPRVRCVDGRDDVANRRRTFVHERTIGAPFEIDRGEQVGLQQAQQRVALHEVEPASHVGVRRRRSKCEHALQLVVVQQAPLALGLEDDPRHHRGAIARGGAKETLRRSRIERKARTDVLKSHRLREARHSAKQTVRFEGNACASPRQEHVMRLPKPEGIDIVCEGLCERCISLERTEG
jgi:hypothetical protein